MVNFSQDFQHRINKWKLCWRMFLIVWNETRSEHLNGFCFQWLGYFQMHWPSGVFWTNHPSTFIAYEEYMNQASNTNYMYSCYAEPVGDRIIVSAHEYWMVFELKTTVSNQRTNFSYVFNVCLWFSFISFHHSFHKVSSLSIVLHSISYR